ncbi:uncharacterized protein [Triticum aestivum]|uniref:uncharacterized protein isoform X2 n=1 Tax=Triticum aestivum TaxID=4565 RepID=UPI001D018DFD|nr:uncharacterized protein LOC123114425 isoform X2 [Triticum aestivum]
MSAGPSSCAGKVQEAGGQDGMSAVRRSDGRRGSRAQDHACRPCHLPAPATRGRAGPGGWLGSGKLFYCCQTSELRCAAMSDLRHRILVLDQRQVIYHPYQQRNCPYAPPENCNSLSST